MSLEIQRKPADAWETTFSAFSTVPILDPILEKPLFRFFNRGLKTRYLRGIQERKAVEETVMGKWVAQGQTDILTVSAPDDSFWCPQAKETEALQQALPVTVSGKYFSNHRMHKAQQIFLFKWLNPRYRFPKVFPYLNC